MRLLVQAIRDRRVVEFRYGGEARAVEPYRLGESGGRLLLQGWQRGKGWRTFAVADMAEVEATDRFWDSPREGFAEDGRLDRVVASVQGPDFA